MLDACGHSLGDLQQHVTMDVILCVQEESGDSLAMPLNMVKALRWYVQASLIPFPDLCGGLFLSSTSLGDAPRKEAMPLPLLIVVELERMLLSDFASIEDRLMSGACLICIWGSLRFADAQQIVIGQ